VTAPVGAVPPGRGEDDLVVGRRREWPLALALLLPSVAVFALFAFYPLVRTVDLAMHRSDPFGGLGPAVGLENIRDVLASASFRNSLEVTCEFALITVPLGIGAGLGLAVLAHQRLTGIGVYRTLFSSTVATSVAVASITWLTLLHPSIGIVNQLLESIGLARIDFLQRPGWALVSVSLATVWQHLGFTFIVVSAGLQSVPDELLESASLDGAGPWRRFRTVTFPLLSPTLLFATVVLTIHAFESFGQIDLLTQGGPLRHTDVLVYSVFKRASGDPSGAAAEALVLFGLVLLLTLAQLRALERRVFYG
jgi:sn-glycerol 3-phosphate transport system permease protein